MWCLLASHQLRHHKTLSLPRRTSVDNDAAIWSSQSLNAAEQEILLKEEVKLESSFFSFFFFSFLLLQSLPLFEKQHKRAVMSSQMEMKVWKSEVIGATCMEAVWLLLQGETWFRAKSLDDHRDTAGMIYISCLFDWISVIFLCCWGLILTFTILLTFALSHRHFISFNFVELRQLIKSVW